MRSLEIRMLQFRELLNKVESKFVSLLGKTRWGTFWSPHPSRTSYGWRIVNRRKIGIRRNMLGDMCQGVEKACWRNPKISTGNPSAFSVLPKLRNARSARWESGPDFQFSRERRWRCLTSHVNRNTSPVMLCFSSMNPVHQSPKSSATQVAFQLREVSTGSAVQADRVIPVLQERQ